MRLTGSPLPRSLVESLCSEYCGSEPGGNRTHDHKLKRLVLYQLSYRPVRQGKSSGGKV